MTLYVPRPFLRLLCGAFFAGLGILSAQEPAKDSLPPAAKASPATVREVADIPYVSGGVERQRLDLYLPDTSPGAIAERSLRPLVVWVHGGGWDASNRQGCPARVLVGRGYVVASLGYRLSSQAIYPAQIEDCKAAIRWLRAHAGEYGIDPTRIGAWGESAGGHLVALLGTTGGTRRFDVGENLDQSSRVQCVLDWFGPTDFLHWGDPPATAILDTPNTALARLIGGPILSHQDLARAASPVYFVDKDSAPFLILHGDKDGTVPLQQSGELNAALQKAGVESTLKVVAGAGHGGPAFTTADNLQLMADFADRHLHPGDPAASAR